MYCKKCGSEFENKENCPQCGTPVKEGLPPEKKKTAGIFLVAVLMLIIIALVFGIVKANQTENIKSESTSVNTKSNQTEIVEVNQKESDKSESTFDNTKSIQTEVIGTENKIKTIKDGFLTVGMEVGYPPMEYFADDGITYIGFDVDLAKKMADLLGLKLKIVNTSWEGIFNSLDKGEFDIIMSSVSITPERRTKYILTKPYISNRIVLAVAEKSTAGITNLSTLAGEKVAVQAATTSDDFAKTTIAKGAVSFDVLRYEKIEQCYNELELGRVDAILVDEFVAAAYADKGNVVWRSDEGELIGICIKKGNDELASNIEKAIDTFYFDGTIATMAKKHFGSNVTEGVRVVTQKPVF